MARPSKFKKSRVRVNRKSRRKTRPVQVRGGGGLGTPENVFDLIKNKVTNPTNLTFRGQRYRFVYEQNYAKKKHTFNDIFNFNALTTYDKQKGVLYLTNITNITKDENYPERNFNDVDGNSDFMSEALAPLGYDYPYSTSATIGNPTWWGRKDTRYFLTCLTSVEPV